MWPVIGLASCVVLLIVILAFGWRALQNDEWEMDQEEDKEE